MPNRKANFDLYRYQVLPVDRKQISLFTKSETTKYSTAVPFSGNDALERDSDSLLEDKNRFFASALLSVKNFSYKQVQINSELIHFEEPNFFVFKLAHRKSLQRETKEFRKESIDNWPSILVAVNNDPDQQIIAVQNRSDAFTNTKAVINAFSNALKPPLYDRRLYAEYHPLFQRESFWNILNKYKDNIKSVEFELVTPNMARISSSLPEDLKIFAKATNSASSGLKLNSPEGGQLTLDEQDRTLSGLVDYCSEGGGNITVKVSGQSKSIKTENSTKSVSVDAIEISGSAVDAVEALKNITKC